MPASNPAASNPVAPDGHLRIERVTDEALVALRARLAPIANTLPPQSVVRKTEEDGEASFSSWGRQLLDPAVVEIALELGVPVRVPSGSPDTYTFLLYHWATRDAPEDSLARVIAHPFFRRVLVNTFFPSRESKDKAGNFLARAVRYETFAPVLAELGPLIAERVRAWTLGAFELHGDWLESLCRPEILERVPGLADAVRSLDIARLVAAQLRGGLVDEWGWPAMDEARERLDGKPDYTHSGPPPYQVFHSVEAKRVVAYGPDGIVFDRAFDSPYPDVRSLWYLGGDVLACSYPKLARWIDSDVELEMPAYGLYSLATGDDSLLTRNGRRVRAGATAIPSEPRRGNARYWFDGAAFYGFDGETSVGRDLSVRDPRAELFTFDPDTGKRGAAALPSWFASLLDDGARLVVTNVTPHVQLAPSIDAPTPLGTKDGLGGAALVQRGGTFECVGIDGRRGPGLVNGLPVAALMTFPERDGYYPLVVAGGDLGVALPDGVTPLVPKGMYGYWHVPRPAPTLAHWYAFRPRDPAGSRALAACTDETARALLGGVPVPGVTHPRIVEAIDWLVKKANEARAAIERIQSHLVISAAPRSTFVNDNARSLATLLGHGMHWWVENEGIELGQQMLDVSHYLFGDERAAVTPARTVFPWDRLLVMIGEVMYRALASGTPKGHRTQLVGVLRAWAETAFPDHLERTRLIELAAPRGSTLLHGIDSDHRDRLVAPGNRYFLRLQRHQNPGEDAQLHAIEFATSGAFVVPDGSTLVQELAIDRRFGRAAIDSALRLAAERVRVELDPSFIALVSKETGLSPTAATLLWSAGYEPWLVGDTARERLKIEHDKIGAAEREIKSKPLAPIYARAMPADPAQVFTLEGAAQLARAWNEAT